MQRLPSTGDEMCCISRPKYIVGHVYPILHTGDLPQTTMAQELVHPTGLSIKAVQDQKHEEWN